MKKNLFTILALLLIPLSGNVLAGTTTLITYYPPPVAAYNQLKLATSATTNCNGNPVGTIFADADGTLHVCMNEMINGSSTVTSVVYPQACYNIFCNYQAPQNSCTPPNAPSSSIGCSVGFGYLESNGNINTTGTSDGSSYVSSTFESSASPTPATYTTAYVCCST